MKKQILFLILSLFISIGALTAQTVIWAKQSKGKDNYISPIFLPTTDNSGNGIATDNSGNVYVTGSFYGTTIFENITLSNVKHKSMFIAKYDLKGHLLWIKESKGKRDCEGYSVAVDPLGNSYVTGYFKDTTIFEGLTLTGYGLFIAKYDTNGNLLWVKQNKGKGDGIGQSICIDDISNTFSITGCFTDTLTIDNTSLVSKGWSDIFIANFDYDGHLQWLKQAGRGVKTNNNYNNSFGITIDPSGNNYITGTFSDTLIVDTIPLISVGKGDLFIAKYSASGNCLWAKQAGGKDYDAGNGISLDNEGNSYITGYFSDTAFFDGIKLIYGSFYALLPRMFIAKYNKDGKVIWARQADNLESGYGLDIKADNSGNSYVCGYSNRQSYITKYDTSGNVLWAMQTKKSDGEMGSAANSIALDNSGNCYVTGYFSGMTILDTISLITNDDPFITDVYVAKIRTHSNTIKGLVFNDLNNNCSKQNGEKALINRIVKIEPGPRYATPDSNGYYAAFVDTGIYTVSLQPSPYWGVDCPSSSNTYTVHFSSAQDSSSTNNFGSNINTYCPLMWVDVSSSLIRACRQNVYSVNYCNKGTADAANSSIRIEFDKNIFPFSSTLPWSAQNGNVYTFNLGTVAAGQCGTFYITDSVSCDAVMGSTVCVKAKIFPDTICTPQSSAWDKSNLTVNGTCVDDSIVRFVIQNTGQSMTGNSNYRIYTNNYLTETKAFQLAANDSIVISLQGKGNTIRLEADQRSGHPGKSHPRATVEACGINDVFAKTLGLFNTVPQDDADDFIEMDCQEVKSSYDPNEKTVNPTGNGIAKCITPTNELEYQINFQNTGNDTAFTITVRDTLPKNLDISTLISGSSSHPYTFRIYGEGIMEWTFNNILLPDSTTNETASHGFVKYRVQQKVNNPNGTVISNRAAIYFDYNFPVITNAAINTVDSAGTVSIKNLGYSIPEARMLIYPNPFNNNTTISIDNKYNNEKTEIVIYDIVGKKIKSYPLQKGQHQLNISSEDIGHGIYICRLEANGKTMATEKMVVVR